MLQVSSDNYKVTKTNTLPARSSFSECPAQYQPSLPIPQLKHIILQTNNKSILNPSQQQQRYRMIQKDTEDTGCSILQDSACKKAFYLRTLKFPAVWPDLHNPSCSPQRNLLPAWHNPIETQVSRQTGEPTHDRMYAGAFAKAKPPLPWIIQHQWKLRNLLHPAFTKDTKEEEEP